MHRLRLMLISQVWKFARRSNVSSDLKILKKMSCDRSSASSCLPTNLYATLKTLRQCCRTIASHAAWSPLRHCSIRVSDVDGESTDMDGGWNHNTCHRATCHGATCTRGTWHAIESSRMQGFYRSAAGALTCDGVSLSDLAA